MFLEVSGVFLERILFATDFSDTSQNALGTLLQLREAGCREVILLHVIDTREAEEVLAEPSAGDDPSGEYERQIAGRRINNAREAMVEIEVNLEAAGYHVCAFVVSGAPAREINRIAAAEKAGMIVIGSHGRTNLLHRLMGSVSLEVIQWATLPVLVIRRSGE